MIAQNLLQRIKNTNTNWCILLIYLTQSYEEGGYFFKHFKSNLFTKMIRHSIKEETKQNTKRFKSTLIKIIDF
jgi:hypothetical protein